MKFRASIKRLIKLSWIHWLKVLNRSKALLLFVLGNIPSTQQQNPRFVLFLSISKMSGSKKAVANYPVFEDSSQTRIGHLIAAGTGKRNRATVSRHRYLDLYALAVMSSLRVLSQAPPSSLDVENGRSFRSFLSVSVSYQKLGWSSLCKRLSISRYMCLRARLPLLYFH